MRTVSVMSEVAGCAGVVGEHSSSSPAICVVRRKPKGGFRDGISRTRALRSSHDVAGRYKRRAYVHRTVRARCKDDCLPHAYAGVRRSAEKLARLRLLRSERRDEQARTNGRRDVVIRTRQERGGICIQRTFLTTLLRQRNADAAFV